MITKGALDVLISRISKIETSEGIVDSTRRTSKEIKKVNLEFSKQGLRVLAFAYKDISGNDKLR